MAVGRGDPEIAFVVHLPEVVIRMDYSAEIGDGSSWWLPGHEEQCLVEWDLFAHGTIGAPASDDELRRYGWALYNAVLSFVIHKVVHEEETAKREGREQDPDFDKMFLSRYFTIDGVARPMIISAQA